MIKVGKRLRFDALRGIHNQHRAFTRLERAADLVAEVYVSGRIDEVELIFLFIFCGVIHAHRGGFDRDAFFAFEVHVVKYLRGHITVGDRACQLQ